MRSKKLKQYSLSELKDRHIGKVGSPKRDVYENNLKKEIDEALYKQSVENIEISLENSPTSLFDKKVSVYKTKMEKLDISYEEEKFLACAKACGSSIYSTDGEKVAASNNVELERVKTNYLINKLGLSVQDNLDDIISYAVKSLGKSNRNKYRAIFYYLCSEKAGIFPV